MTIYFFIVFSSAFLGFLYSKARDRNIIILAQLLCFLTLFLPAALRYGIGTDYFTYEKEYQIVVNNKKSSVELGYAIVSRLGHFLGWDVQFVFVFMSFFTLFFLFHAVPRNVFFLLSCFMLYYFTRRRII